MHPHASIYALLLGAAWAVPVRKDLPPDGQGGLSEPPPNPFGVSPSNSPSMAEIFQIFEAMGLFPGIGQSSPRPGGLEGFSNTDSVSSNRPQEGTGGENSGNTVEDSGGQSQGNSGGSGENDAEEAEEDEGGLERRQMSVYQFLQGANQGRPSGGPINTPAFPNTLPGQGNSNSNSAPSYGQQNNPVPYPFNSNNAPGLGQQNYPGDRNRPFPTQPTDPSQGFGTNTQPTEGSVEGNTGSGGDEGGTEGNMEGNSGSSFGGNTEDNTGEGGEESNQGGGQGGEGGETKQDESGEGGEGGEEEGDEGGEGGQD